MTTFRDLANRQHGPSKATDPTARRPIVRQPAPRRPSPAVLARLNAFSSTRERNAFLGKLLDGAICPDCASELEVQHDVETLDPSTGARRIAARVAFCSGCEYAREF